MTTETLDHTSDFVVLAGGVVAAYVAHNSVPISELPGLIERVHGAVASLASGSATVGSAAISHVDVEKPSPAEIRKSVRPDGIISFIDGKTYKTLKRHLTSRGLDPKSYRDRYGLPSDYPMVAPSYAERRSALAKAIGLGVPAHDDQRRSGTRRAVVPARRGLANVRPPRPAYLA